MESTDSNIEELTKERIINAEKFKESISNEIQNDPELMKLIAERDALKFKIENNSKKYNISMNRDRYRIQEAIEEPLKFIEDYVNKLANIKVTD